MPDRRRWFELEQEKLKEKLDEEVHKAARPMEELAPGDPYFTRIQGMLAIKNELENIPLSGTQRDMLLAMENVLEQAWAFRNTPVPGRCMNPENISEVVYYFLQDKGAEYRAGLLYDRAKANLTPAWRKSPLCRQKKYWITLMRKSSKRNFYVSWRRGWTNGKPTSC